MGELLQALRDRRDELDISHETLDQISGLQSGYVSKPLAPKPIKNLGPVSLGPLLGALGVAITVVPDKEAIAAVKHRWQKRKRPQRLRPIQAASITAEIQITPELSAQLTPHERIKVGASIGGKRRAKILGKRERHRIAAHAARIRWAKRRASAT
jgi:hypothetical protein